MSGVVSQGRWWAVLVLLGAGLVAGAAAPAAQSVREAAVAGSWYSDRPATLAAYLDGLLDPSPRALDPAQLRALVLPHAGYRFSGQTAAVGLAPLHGRAYRRVVVIGPSHYSPFHGVSVADVGAYRTPLGDIALDRGAVGELRETLGGGDGGLFHVDPRAHRREHSIEMTLPLLQRALRPGWQLVPVLVGQLREADYPLLAAALKPLLTDQTLLVVSSDFTHYGANFGYRPFPPDQRAAARIDELDHGAFDLMVARDWRGLLDYRRRTGITICGLNPVAVLLALLPDGARVEELAYTTSAAASGDYRHSVSYFAIAVLVDEPLADAPGAATAAADDPHGDSDDASSGTRAALTRQQLALLHRRALDGIDMAVLGVDEPTRVPRTAALPDALTAPSGAFVTLKSNGRLRGCIGYIAPIEPMDRAVLENGFNAAGNDRRFRPVRPTELPGLEVEVSVLTPPRPIASYRDFEVGKQGIILTKDGRSAVFLPEVATEQGWTREQTLGRLSLKAGLPSDAWKDGASFEVFESQTYTAPYR